MRTCVRWIDSVPRPSPELPAAPGYLELSEDIKAVFDVERTSQRSHALRKTAALSVCPQTGHGNDEQPPLQVFSPPGDQYSKSLCFLALYNTTQDLRKRLDFRVGLHRERMIDGSAGKGLRRPVRHQTCSPTGREVNEATETRARPWARRGVLAAPATLSRLPFAGSGTWQRLVSRAGPWRKALPWRGTRPAPGRCSGQQRRS